MFIDFSDYKVVKDAEQFDWGQLYNITSDG